jgi:predicted nucleic acid-binding protein
MTSVYFDASVLVSLFVDDDLSIRAATYLGAYAPAPVLSDFAAAEFASAINRLVRMRILAADQAATAFAAFDVWRAGPAVSQQTLPADIRAAEVLLRRLDLPLTAPDVLHLAIAQRLELAVATFDERMADTARKLGVAVAPA